MDKKIGSGLQNLRIEGSRERGYRAAGEHFYTWQLERAEALSWVEELSRFDRHTRRRQQPNRAEEPESH